MSHFSEIALEHDDECIAAGFGRCRHQVDPFEVPERTPEAFTFRPGTWDMPSYSRTGRTSVQWHDLSVFELAEAERDLNEMVTDFNNEVGMYRMKLAKRLAEIEAQA
jgi:hypothetical protein